ncbi:adenosylcobinamide-phosphate synthase CbiB [Acetobacter conturbans]|uniref:Cobalamin biosynthesis protein CobD n=1 Tax=Acetobacter conturbans TaxID=1737472 RepID=A0ABX0K4T1_9PROT|nr:adenosylcobinamide-phosphate synthase CbiB [Acetobacter conturbans]NHN89620.1 cobalamin biosynthesis protein CobD [Acetobacter conturbans]
MTVPLIAPATAAVAAAIEGLLGYPAPLFRRISHPVVWIGTLMAWLDRRFNDPTASRTRKIVVGGGALIVETGVPTLLAVLFTCVVRHQAVVMGLVASSCVAQRSLHQHVEAVADGLEQGGLEEGRQAVSQIVGRDPATLDEAAVARAAIESLAENFSDGVVAPLFWCAVGGLPGAVFYKAVNTADSMIGHRSERYEAFGKVAAKMDDLINLPASRLAVVWIVLAAFVSGKDWRGALLTVWRDSHHHRSPNAGWPEAAMAGALGVALAGPRTYGGVVVPDHPIGDGRREATAADIRTALCLYRRACWIQFGVLVGLTMMALKKRR